MQTLEQREIAAAPGAEAEVAPYQQPGGAQAARHHVLDEAFGGQSRQPGIEARHMYARHAGGGHQLELVAQAREARGRRCRGEELARMRLKGQDAGGDLQVARARDRPLEHRQMAAVHAVEVANGERLGTGSRRDGPVRDPHPRV